MKPVIAAAPLALGLFAPSALAAPVPLSAAQLSGVVAGEDFSIVNEVSDQFAIGSHPADVLLVNAWGLSAAPAGGPLWVSNNGSGTSTLYNFTTFNKIPLNATIPGAGGGHGNPTATVFPTLPANT